MGHITINCYKKDFSSGVLHYVAAGMALGSIVPSTIGRFLLRALQRFLSFNLSLINVWLRENHK